MNIKKHSIISQDKLSGEFYFNSIIQEAYTHELLSESEIENIQLQCLKLLANKSERYNGGNSSSIRIEAAENIMKSNLYTIGLFLKSFSDIEDAIKELKTVPISEIYKNGRELITVKEHSAKYMYHRVKSNKIANSNYTYNATIDEQGIGSFFKQYNPDYEAHEALASIDYQLCNPVTDLAGIEFIQKYTQNLYLENEFCSYFNPINIHYLLSGYDEGYQDLLINIFEQVLTSAIGCVLTHHSVFQLDNSQQEIKQLYNELSRDNDKSISLKINKAAQILLQELKIKSILLRNYIEEGLPKITLNIIQAVRTNTLEKTIVSAINPDLKPRIQFLSGIKMEDKNYRTLIEELLICRHSSDKLALIKDKVKSFKDMEDILFDAGLNKEEIVSVLNMFGNVEIAALMKRHPFKSEIQAVDLTESEYTLRAYLKIYYDQQTVDRQGDISAIINQLVDE